MGLRRLGQTHVVDLIMESWLGAPFPARGAARLA
jgi:hypothetical protein